MSVALPAPPLLFITDRKSTVTALRDIVPSVLAAGCRWIMVREKDLGTAPLTALARDIVTLARPFDACVVVNGDVEAARASGAGGVHIQSAAGIGAARQTLGAAALIGVSTHSRAEAAEAAAAGADYVTLSPVFLTESKPGYGPALDIAGLANTCSAVAIPVIALAGIAPANAASCLRAGASGVASMGGIMHAVDPAAAVRDLIDALTAAENPV